MEIRVADVAASFREAVVDVLLGKAIAACQDLGVPRLLLGGGVVANARLRAVAAERCEAAGIALRIPPLSLCTDNGAMIAGVGARAGRRGTRAIRPRIRRRFLSAGHHCPGRTSILRHALLTRPAPPHGDAEVCDPGVCDVGVLTRGM